MQNEYIEQLQNKLRILENENRMLREIIEWNDIDIPESIKPKTKPQPVFNPKPTVKYASEPMHAPDVSNNKNNILPDVPSFSADKKRAVTDPMEVISTINGKYSSKGAENISSCDGLSMLDSLSRRFSTQSFLAAAEAMSNERILSQESIFESISENDMPEADSNNDDILNMLLNDSLDDDDIILSDEDGAYLDNVFDNNNNNNDDNNNDDDGIFW